MAIDVSREVTARSQHSLRNRLLQFSIILTFLFALILFVAVNALGQKSSERLNKKLMASQTASLVAEIGQYTARVESIANGIGRLAASSPDSNKLESLFSPLLEQTSTNIEIVAAAVWSDTVSQDLVIEPSGYRWYRNENTNRSEYIVGSDQYNAHSQAWFMIAQTLKEGQAYWQQEGVDPLTGLATVICAVPFSRDGKRLGVVSLRVIFPTFSHLMTYSSMKYSGYALVLDNTGQFISYPFPEKVLRNTDSGLTKFISLSQLVEKDSSFMPILKAVKDFKSQQAFKYQSSADNKLKTKVLMEANTDLTLIQANNIVGFYQQPFSQSKLAAYLPDVELSLIGETATAAIFSMAKTQWTIVMLVPQRLLTSDFDAFQQNLIILTGLLLFVLIACLSLLFERLITRQFKRLDSAIIAKDLSGECVDIASPYYELDGVVQRVNEKTAAEVKARERADASNFSQWQLSEDISQEIRIPMNTILSSASLLKGSNITERDKEYVNLIEKSASATLIVMDDMAHYNKVMSGELVFEQSRFDLLSVLDHVYTSLRLKVDPNLRVRFSLNYSENAHRFFIGDEKYLQRILIDLVDNAIKYTSRGFVEMKVHSEGVRGNEETLVFHIVDTGIGIPQSKIAHLFDHEITTKKAYFDDLDPGLTLTLCHRLIILMGGTLEINSVLGEGTEFKIHLPLKRAYQNSTANMVSGNATALTRLIGMNVLVVEENKVNQVLIKKILTTLEIQSQVISDFSEISQLDPSVSFDVIYSHVQIRDSFHTELNQLKTSFPNVPIIAVMLDVVSGHYNLEEFSGSISRPLSRQSFIDETVRVLGFESSVDDVVLKLKK